MEPLRTPDFAFQDQLLTETYDHDEELHKIILQSRQEYLEQEKQRRQREQQKINLQKNLAVPISRLHLWKKTCSNKQEKQCLHHILNILYIKTHPERDDDDIHIPTEHQQEILAFLDKNIKPSPLFQQVYEICTECLLEM